MYTYKPCAVNGCTKFGRVWSRYCRLHEDHVTCHGWHGGRTMMERELTPYARTIDDALARYRGRVAVVAAHRVADEVLNYVPAAPVVSSAFEKASSLLTMLRNEGVTPEAFLRRVCVVWLFVDSNRNRYPNSIAEDMALARGAVRLVSPSYVRPNARTLRHLGTIIRQYLGLFVATFLKRIEDDEETRRRDFSSKAFDEVVS